MSSRLSDPQRLVELLADQMFREEMRSRNRHWPAAENGAGPPGAERERTEAARERGARDD
jgi:hypothetical protein